MITAKLTLFDYNKPTKNGYPVKIRLTDTINKQSKYINLKEYAFSSTWNSARNEPTSNHPSYSKTLTLVLEWRIKLESEIPKINSLKLNLDQAIEYLQKPFTDEDDFSAFARGIISELKQLAQNKKQGKGKTAEKKENALNSFELFHGSNKILFSQITSSYLKSYIKWAQNIRGISNNGVHTYLAALKSMYNLKMSSTLPFKGIMPKLQKTRSKSISVPLFKVLHKEVLKNINNPVSSISGMENCIDYFVLCFLLGGLDIVDIAALKKTNISNNRIIFQRHKGGTDEWINNIIVPQAEKLILKYNSESDYLFPIHQIPVYKTFYGRYLTNLRLLAKKYSFQEYISSKSPRYSFINYAKNAGVPREVCSEIVGHSQNDVHSIYESGFPDDIKNTYHLQVIEVIC